MTAVSQNARENKKRRDREYYQRNKQTIIDRATAWNRENPARRLEITREHHARYREDPDFIERRRQSQARYAAKHPERNAESREKYAQSHPGWAAAHQVARGVCPPGPCRKCGALGRTDVHHKDEDWQNNSPSNLERLCRLCHKELHSQFL